MKDFCRIYHKGQQDKAGKDYVEGHLSTVADNFKKYSKEWYVAWLHDILEDTECTINELEEQLKKDEKAKRFYDEIIDAVQAITKQKNESKEKYLKRVKKNDLARKVKIADMEHNSDLGRIKNPTKSDYKRVEYYEKGIKYLKENDEFKTFFDFINENF